MRTSNWSWALLAAAAPALAHPSAEGPAYGAYGGSYGGAYGSKESSSSSSVAASPVLPSYGASSSVSTAPAYTPTSSWVESSTKEFPSSPVMSSIVTPVVYTTLSAPVYSSSSSSSSSLVSSAIESSAVYPSWASSYSPLKSYGTSYTPSTYAASSSSSSSSAGSATGSSKVPTPYMSSSSAFSTGAVGSSSPSYSPSVYSKKTWSSQASYKPSVYYNSTSWSTYGASSSPAGPAGSSTKPGSYGSSAYASSSPAGPAGSSTASWKPGHYGSSASASSSPAGPAGSSAASWTPGSYGSSASASSMDHKTTYTTTSTTTTSTIYMTMTKSKSSAASATPSSYPGSSPSVKSYKGSSTWESSMLATTTVETCGAYPTNTITAVLSTETVYTTKYVTSVPVTMTHSMPSGGVSYHTTSTASVVTTTMTSTIYQTHTITLSMTSSTTPGVSAAEYSSTSPAGYASSKASSTSPAGYASTKASSSPLGGAVSSIAGWSYVASYGSAAPTLSVALPSSLSANGYKTVVTTKSVYTSYTVVKSSYGTWVPTPYSGNYSASKTMKTTVVSYTASPVTVTETATSYATVSASPYTTAYWTKSGTSSWVHTTVSSSIASPVPYTTTKTSMTSVPVSPYTTTTLVTVSPGYSTMKTTDVTKTLTSTAYATHSCSVWSSSGYTYTSIIAPTSVSSTVTILSTMSVMPYQGTPSVSPVASGTGSAITFKTSSGTKSAFSSASSSGIAHSISGTPSVSPVTTPVITPTPKPTSVSPISGSGHFCKRVPVPDCTPCEGMPDSDPNNFCGLTAETNYYEVFPVTCMKVICDLTVKNVTITPDGVPRMASAFEGQMPGPHIEAVWGDMMEVTVTNDLTANGSSTHFHGLRQLNSNPMDGVPSIVQCPIPGNGGAMTYKFNLTQYGTTWYHSHYSLQAWEGAIGPMTVYGPKHVEYDIDLGPVLLQDWLHTTVFSLFEGVEQSGAPVQDNVLVNGKNIFTDPATGTTTGSRAEFTLTPGKKHRMRLVSGALDSYFAFSIDQHEMTVIATDLVPIQPYTTDILNIGIGQRYDVIVEAKQTPGDYWMRVDSLSKAFAPGVPPCGSPSLMDGDTRAIVHYEGFTATPTSTAYTHSNDCTVEPLASAVPYLALDAGGSSQTVSETVVIAQDPSTKVFRWRLNGTPFQVQFGEPTLLDVYENSTAYSNALAVEVPQEKEWVYVIIESPIPLPHPIHLHGHDFYVLGAGQGNFDPATSPIQLTNPPRRDVQLLPAGGYLVLAFYTDNPGVWLMHCHIGWHVSMGFALQFIENKPGIEKLLDGEYGTMLNDQCTNYNQFAIDAFVVEDDSGV